MISLKILKSLVVMFVAVTLAAIAQELIAPIPYVSIKMPCLIGVCTYYAVYREIGYGVCAAVWCGILWDGLGAVPYGVGLITLLAIVLASQTFVKKQMSMHLPTCMLVAAIGAVVLDVFSATGLYHLGELDGVSVLFLGLRWITMFVVGAGVAGVVAFGTHTMDRMLRNVELEHEKSALG